MMFAACQLGPRIRGGHHVGNVGEMPTKDIACAYRQQCAASSFARSRDAGFSLDRPLDIRPTRIIVASFSILGDGAEFRGRHVESARGRHEVVDRFGREPVTGRLSDVDGLNNLRKLHIGRFSMAVMMRWVSLRAKGVAR